MEKRLKEWGAKLDELASKATAVGEEAIEKEKKAVAELRAKRDAVQTKVTEMKAAGSDKWQTIKLGVDSAYEELEAAFKKVTQ
jgi:hypothetical protein